MEVLSLHAVLKEAEETLSTSPLLPVRAERVKVVKDGCNKVLVDLQSLVEQYQNLGTQSKRTWDRMRWCNEDIAEIRGRLTASVTMLTAIISTSQTSVENKLDKLMEEFRQGKREGSLISLQTVDSLSADDRVVWRAIRKDFEEIGITLAAFEANREFIFDWFNRALESGAFEEQNGHGVHEKGIHSEEQESGNRGEQSSESASETEPNVPERGPETFHQILTFTRAVPIQIKPQVPRGALLSREESHPRRRLLKAVGTGDAFKALKIFRDKTSFHTLDSKILDRTHTLDSKTLDRALSSATCQVDGAHDPCPVIVDLIARGGNVNYISSNSRERTPLWNSVAQGSYDVVRLLVEHGADVHYKGSDRICETQLEGKALDFAPRASLTGDPAILRLLLSSGVDVNIQYQTCVQSLSYYKGCNWMSLLHEAAALGAVPAMETLLEFGAEIDAVSPIYGTALMLALLKRQENAAQFLLVKGADPNFEADIYSASKRPMEAAILGGKASLVTLLLDHGVVPDDSALGLARIAKQFGKRKHVEEHLDVISMLNDRLKQGE